MFKVSLAKVQEQTLLGGPSCPLTLSTLSCRKVQLASSRNHTLIPNATLLTQLTLAALFFKEKGQMDNPVFGHKKCKVYSKLRYTPRISGKSDVSAEE